MLTHSLAVISALLLAQAPAPRVLSVDPAGSKLTYHVVHKLHEVEGTSSTVEGKIAFMPDGQVRVMVRAPVASFRSGDANRDSHMRETLETGKYAYVTFKGVTRVSMPASVPSTVEVSVPGELDFHGRKRQETIPMKVQFTSASEMRATGAFDVSLDKYEVERPALLFVKIEDNCRIGVDLLLREEHP